MTVNTITEIAHVYGTVQLQLNTRVMPHVWCMHFSVWTEK